MSALWISKHYKAINLKMNERMRDNYLFILHSKLSFNNVVLLYTGKFQYKVLARIFFARNFFACCEEVELFSTFSLL